MSNLTELNHQYDSLLKKRDKVAEQLKSINDSLNEIKETIDRLVKEKEKGRFLGVISTPSDFDKITKKINVGDTILILDNKYNKNWVCVDICKYGNYFMPLDPLMCSYIDPDNNCNDFYKSEMYKKILPEILSFIAPILGNHLQIIHCRDNKNDPNTCHQVKITLPDVKQIAKDYSDDKSCFEYFRRLYKEDNKFYTEFSKGTWTWTRTVASGSSFCAAYSYGIVPYNLAANGWQAVRPLLLIK